jgi:hypothetical protein
LTLGSGKGNKSGSGSGMNNQDHISESFEKIFWVKILKFFDADSDGEKNSDPESEMEKIRIRDKETFQTATLLVTVHTCNSKII